MTATGNCALHECPVCHSDLVQAEEWKDLDDGTWSLNLRCPNCETRRCVVVDDEAIDAFDGELNAGTDEMVAWVDRLSRENFEAYIERFETALRNDAIMPEDFA